MSFTIPRKGVITCAPGDLRSWFVYGYEWIDNLHFILSPRDFLGDEAPAYVSVVEELFRESGWQGDGDVGLLWLPPFVFDIPNPSNPSTHGIALWHAKQEEDGVSFILSPIRLPFTTFDGQD